MRKSSIVAHGAPAIFQDRIASGLREMRGKEREALIPILLFAVLLFLVGAMLGHLALAKIIGFLMNLQIGNMAPMFSPGEFLNLELKFVIGFGVAFQLPTVLMILTMVGVVTPHELSKYRPYSVVFIATLSMMLTPPDPLSMIVMMIPLFVLYEISIWACAPIAYRRQAAMEEFDAKMEEEYAKYLEEENKTDKKPCSSI